MDHLLQQFHFPGVPTFIETVEREQILPSLTQTLFSIPIFFVHVLGKVYPICTFFTQETGITYPVIRGLKVCIIHIQSFQTWIFCPFIGICFCPAIIACHLWIWSPIVKCIGHIRTDEAFVSSQTLQSKRRNRVLCKMLTDSDHNRIQGGVS